MNKETLDDVKELVWEIENNPHPENAIYGLNKIIAVEAGYTVNNVRHHELFAVFTPEGEKYSGTTFSEKQAWHYAPDFAMSSDACFKLPIDDIWFWQVAYPLDDGRASAKLECSGFEETDSYRAESFQVSLAMCLCWCEYRYGQNRSIEDKGE